MTEHNQRAKYYQDRNKQVISIDLRDPKLKEAIRLAAEREHRTINGWMEHYIFPIVEAELDRQQVVKKKK